MNFPRIVTFTFFLMAIFAAPVHAQEPQSPATLKAKPSTTAPAGPAQQSPVLADPPYQARLERLSEILGALHYLHPLCVKKDDPVWRELMLNLLEAVNPTQNARDRMIASFNHAYRGFRENYRNCTPSARLATRRYREEGVKLSRDLTSLFTD